MTIDRQLLELELRLLILRHGRQEVLAAVAALGEQSIAGVTGKIASVEQEHGRKKGRGPRRPRQRAASVVKGPPETQGVITSLLDGYKKRTFLPRLHDVERFLNHAGVAHGRLKSRTEALPKVTKVLCELPKAHLERLDRDAGLQRESDFALLAEEIVGGRGRARRTDESHGPREVPPA